MDPTLERDRIAIGDLLQATERIATAFLTSVADRPAGVPARAYPIARLPDAGGGAAATLDQFMERFGADITGSAGPRYLAFVTGGATPAALVGDWLTSVFDQNGTGESPAASHIEHEAISLLRELFGLSTDHAGTFVTGTTMASFVSLAIARQWVGRKHGVDVAEAGLAAIPPFRLLSGSPHSSVLKAMAMLGLGRGTMERVRCLPGREAVDVTALREALARGNGAPAVVVANAGVVNTVDFDELQPILDLKREFDFWLHVDGAFGGFAACSPRYRHLVAGLDSADSIAIDAHKWLNVPYDSAMQFTRHPSLQADVFASRAAYLRLPDAPVEFVERTPESSRRVRALAAWFSLMAYGRDGYRDIVERCCDRARELADRIEQSAHYRLLAPVRMNVVCFTLRRPDVSASMMDRVLGRLRDGGKAFATPTTLGGVPGCRAAFSNWRTEPADLEIIWQGFEAAAADVGA